MAKLKFGAIVTEGCGKLGGHVFAKQNGTAYIKTNTAQKNNTNIAAQQRKSITKSIMSLWSRLTPGERQMWDNETEFYNKKNIFGDTVKYNGFQLFQKLNQGRVLASNSIIDEPIKFYVNDMFTPSVVNASSASLLITNTNYASTTAVIIYATGVLPNGVNKADRYLKKIALVNGGSLAGGVDVINEYVSVFGNLVASTKIAIGYKIINLISGYTTNEIYLQPNKVEIYQTNYYTGLNGATPIPYEVNGTDGWRDDGCNFRVNSAQSYNSLFSIESYNQSMAYGCTRFDQVLQPSTAYVLVFDSKLIGTGDYVTGVNYFNGSNIAIDFDNNTAWKKKELFFTTGSIPNNKITVRFFPDWDVVKGNQLFIDNIKIFEV